LRGVALASGWGDVELPPSTRLGLEKQNCAYGRACYNDGEKRVCGNERINL